MPIHSGMPRACKSTAQAERSAALATNHSQQRSSPRQTNKPARRRDRNRPASAIKGASHSETPPRPLRTGYFGCGRHAGRECGKLSKYVVKRRTTLPHDNRPLPSGFHQPHRFPHPGRDSRATGGSSTPRRATISKRHAFTALGRERLAPHYQALANNRVKSTRSA